MKFKLTHLGKILWPELKITKADLVDYYQGISEKILGYLKDRPVTVQRCPKGINKECWIQKEAPEKLPSWIKTFSFKSLSDKHQVNYILVNNLDTLMWLVNLDSIEFHIWFSRVQSITIPDWIIFDLDLEKKGAKKDLIKVAYLLKEKLKEEKIFLKTTGKTGLHLLVENGKRLNYEKARKWARKIVLELDKKYPDLIATEARIKKRKGRIFIDPAQNSLGRTMVAPYSLRTTKKATISMPISWSDLKNFNQEKYNIKSINS